MSGKGATVYHFLRRPGHKSYKLTSSVHTASTEVRTSDSQLKRQKRLTGYSHTLLVQEEGKAYYLGVYTLNNLLSPIG